MKIIFINYFSYIASSGVHIHFIANEMTRMGHECLVVVPEVTNTNVFGEPLYKFSSYHDFSADLMSGRYGRDTILHAWTPRAASRIPTEFAAKTLGTKYFVHLEDNERRILETQLHKPYLEILQEARKEGVGNFDPVLNPILLQQFIDNAAGVSVLMDKLAEFVPSSVPIQLIWPACEREFFQIPPEPNMALRRKLGIADDARVIVYPGNIHPNNFHTVSSLYKALPILNDMGHKVRLVRCAGVDDTFSDATAAIRKEFVIEKPGLPSKNLPQWIAMADVLVQPGVPDEFDEYRFPSKLPLFLASGRPVLLGKTNIGRFLKDGENCLILEDNSPQTLANKIAWTLDHKEEGAKIGHNGRKFAAQNFNWKKTAQTLLDFYAANSAPNA